MSADGPHASTAEIVSSTPCDAFSLRLQQRAARAGRSSLPTGDGTQRAFVSVGCAIHLNYGRHPMARPQFGCSAWSWWCWPLPQCLRLRQPVFFVFAAFVEHFMVCSKRAAAALRVFGPRC
jgi:hypothetical protein